MPPAHIGETTSSSLAMIHILCTFSKLTVFRVSPYGFHSQLSNLGRPTILTKVLRPELECLILWLFIATLKENQNFES